MYVATPAYPVYRYTVKIMLVVTYTGDIACRQAIQWSLVNSNVTGTLPDFNEWVNGVLFNSSYSDVFYAD